MNVQGLGNTAAYKAAPDAAAVIPTMSRRAVGSPPERCTCRQPRSAASRNTRAQVAVSSSPPGRVMATGLEQ